MEHPLTVPQEPPSLPLHSLSPAHLSTQPSTILTKPVMADSPSDAHPPTLLTTAQTSFFNIEEHLCYLLPQVLSQINEAIQSGWSKSTVNQYSRAIHQFIAFCDSITNSSTSMLPCWWACTLWFVTNSLTSMLSCWQACAMCICSL